MQREIIKLTIKVLHVLSRGYHSVSLQTVYILFIFQGFEVVIAGRKYFAFSMYKKSGQKNVTSFCDQTLPGWSHDTFDRDWACFSGKKMTTVPPKTYYLPDNER